MSSTHETGDAINVANFNQLLSRIKGPDIPYNPGAPAIKMSALDTLLANAQTSLLAVSGAGALYNNAVAVRMATFDAMPLFATQVIGQLRIFKPGPTRMKKAIALQRKIRGRRADTGKPAPEVGSGSGDPTADVAPDDKTISVSQLSYDQQAQHFSNLVALVSTLPTYDPTEDEFKVAALEAYRDNLLLLNKELDNLATNLFSARYNRNLLLYAPDNGIYDAARLVKSYVRAITAYNDPRYLDIAGIKFTKKKA